MAEWLRVMCRIRLTLCSDSVMCTCLSELFLINHLVLTTNGDFLVSSSFNIGVEVVVLLLLFLVEVTLMCFFEMVVTLVMMTLVLEVEEWQMCPLDGSRDTNKV